MSIQFFRALLFLSLSLFTHSTLEAQSNKLEYSYDALGRLIFVKDSVNGNRDFTFDSAGNRTGVAAGADVQEGDSDRLSKPLLAPTGLSSHGPITQSGGYPSKWNKVENAEYYIFRTVDNKESTVYGLSVTKQTEARWVRACNSVFGCGPKAYF